MCRRIVSFENFLNAAKEYSEKVVEDRMKLGEGTDNKTLMEIIKIFSDYLDKYREAIDKVIDEQVNLIAENKNFASSVPIVRSTKNVLKLSQQVPSKFLFVLINN